MKMIFFTVEVYNELYKLYDLDYRNEPTARCSWVAPTADKPPPIKYGSQTHLACTSRKESSPLGLEFDETPQINF